MSLKVKIVDNKTGRVIVDDDNVKAFIGGIGCDGSARSLGIGAECNPIVLLHTVEATQAALAGITEKHPELTSISKLLSLTKDLSHIEEVLKEVKKEMESNGD